MKIFFKTLMGRTLELNVEASDRIEVIKANIEDKFGYEKVCALIYAGKQLEDERTLTDYSISDETTLHLLVRLIGGGIGKGGIGFKFNSLSRPVIQEFGHNLPDYREVSQGLCFKSKCIHRG